MRRRLWQLVTILAWSSSACVGTSTGNPVIPPPEVPTPGESSNTDGSCDSTRMQLDGLDAVSPIGLSAAEMLALAQAQAETTIEWLASDQLTYGPESGTGGLTVDVEPRAGGNPRFVDRKPKSGGHGGAEIATIAGACPDVIELDVSVHVQTEGGALDERFDTTLSARSENVAQLYVTRKAADVEGSLEAELASDDSLPLSSLQLSLKFSKLGPTGSLTLQFASPMPASSEGPNVAVSSSAALPVARWPAGVHCEDEPGRPAAFPAEIDQPVDMFSARDGVDRFNAASLQLTAEGSTPAKLEVKFTPRGGACAALESSELGPMVSVPSISVSGDLAVRSDDARIDGTWPVQLKASAAEDGSLAEVEVAYDLNGSIIASLVDAAEFESTYGIHGFDVSGYDQAGIVVNVTLGPGDALSGELIVNGVKRPACQTQPAPTPTPGAPSTSTAPCAGLQFTPIWTATISAGG